VTIVHSLNDQPILISDLRRCRAQIQPVGGYLTVMRSSPRRHSAPLTRISLGAAYPFSMPIARNHCCHTQNNPLFSFPTRPSGPAIEELQQVRAEPQNLIAGHPVRDAVDRYPRGDGIGIRHSVFGVEAKRAGKVRRLGGASRAATG
jgi:hypothetical protein